MVRTPATMTSCDLILLPPLSADRGGYRAINAEVPSESEVLARIHSADDPMPPEDAEKQLTDAERDIITRWGEARRNIRTPLGIRAAEER